jgi:phage recombination protein Bet
MPEIKLTLEQKELMKRTILAEYPSDECELFFQTVERTQLDPFSRMIYPTKREDKSSGRVKLVPLVSIDGFRLISARSGKYAGQVGPFWCGSDGKWLKDEAGLPMPWLSKEPPSAALVGILHKDFDQPLYSVARFQAYAARYKDGNLQPFWAKMSDLMIGKVAEALARRTAFPNELAGLYTPEEMAQAENQATPRPVLTVKTAADPDEYKTLGKLLADMGCRKGASEEADAVLSLLFPDLTLQFVHDNHGAAQRALEELSAKLGEGMSLTEIRRHAMQRAGLWSDELESQGAEVF